MSDTTLSLSTPSRQGLTEDWVSLGIGLFVLILALAGTAGPDLLGWVVTTSVWTDVTHALAPTAKSYAWLGGGASLLATYVALLAVLSIAAAALDIDVKRFAIAFTAVFWIAYTSWIIGSYAHFAAVTPADCRNSASTGRCGSPMKAAISSRSSPDSSSPISSRASPNGSRRRCGRNSTSRSAIVILGAFLAVTIAGQLESRLVAHAARRRRDHRGLSHLLGRGLFRRPQMVRLQPRMGGAARLRHFDLRRAAAIATGGAIRARPVVPVLVSSLVVVFAVVEVLILPFLAQTFLSTSRSSPAAWMGLAVKTDGAAVAGGGITEALILAKMRREGINYQPGWMLGTTATIKIFIDVFIGIWAFMLAYIWTQPHQCASGRQARGRSEIWERFPKFIIGFVLTFPSGFIWRSAASPAALAKLTPAIGEANTFRVIFFILTFFSIGVLSNFRKLWAGRHRQACRGLCRQPVRLRDLGRPADLLDLLCGIKPPLAG